jgi:hypothetical protein
MANGSIRPLMLHQAACQYDENATFIMGASFGFGEFCMQGPFVAHSIWNLCVQAGSAPEPRFSGVMLPRSRWPCAMSG